VVQAGSGKKQDPIAGNMGQALEHLPSKYGALHSNSNMAKKNIVFNFASCAMDMLRLLLFLEISYTNI
jgi:hypothetical protein